MDIFWAAVIGGLVGGLTVLIGLAFLLHFQLRSGGADFVGFSVERTKDYSEVTLTAHEVRTGGMWVRLDNSGCHEASYVSMRLSLFDGDRLVAQHQLMSPPVPASRVSEFVIPILDEQHQRIEIGDYRYELSFESASAEV